MQTDAALKIRPADKPADADGAEESDRIPGDIAEPDATATSSMALDPNAAQPAAEVSASWNLPTALIGYDDPLLVCLAILAGEIRQPISTEALKSGLPQTDDKFTPELCLRAAERAGLKARLIHRAKVADILSVSLPCILLLKNANACVLLRIVDSVTVEVATPDSGGGRQKMALADLEADFIGHAIFAKADSRFDARAADIRLSQSRPWFWGTLMRFWPIYGHVVLASIVVNCFAIASPLFIMNVYDRVVPNNAFETLWVLAAGMVTVFFFDFLLRNLRNYFVDVAGKNADVIIASDLLRHVMAMRLDQKPPSTGALANNLREFESLRDFFTSGTLLAFVDLPFVLLFIAVIWMIGGAMAFIPLAMVPIIILVGFMLQAPLTRVIERSFKESMQKHSVLVEAIDGLETIKTSRAEGRIQKVWERFVGLSAESTRMSRIITTLSTSFSQTAIQLTSVLMVILGVYLISEGELTIGGLIACTILVGRALAPLGAIAAMLTRLQQSRIALKSLDTLMRVPVERPLERVFLHRPILKGEIEFRNVTFKYPTQVGTALAGMSMHIKPGERVGIIGRIGSGKSTIARLILGLFEPAEGAVHMDGTDLRQIDPADLRRNIAYVSQDNYLFFGTVRDNIAFGAPQVDDAAVIRAATVAGVSDFVRHHPQGYDMQVGERGMSLSGGQRQAITIARAILLDPPIILLDEPTSSMDNSSEAMFRKRMEPHLTGKTVVLITHRASLLPLVNRLIVIDGGKVIADGPRDDILQNLRRGQVKIAG
jgi:ATP-binding cassette subfamily C protein LapB